MKAIVQREYGSPSVLSFEDIDRPAPADDEVLIRVHAASVGPWVWRLVGPDPRIMRIAGIGLRRPKQMVPGADMAGRVEAVGRHVTRFGVGDLVYGEASGAFAEYVAAPEANLDTIPPNLDFEAAAAVPVAANTALLGLRDHGHVGPGQRVLVIGASGGVGSFAIQLAKVFGAEVTGVCSSGSVDFVRRLGADHVLDYTVDEIGAGAPPYDMILQLGGTTSAAGLRHSLTRNGILVLSSGEGGPWLGPIGRIVKAVVTSPFVSQTYRPFYATPRQENLVELSRLLESGAIRAVVDRTYPLSAAADAVRSAQHDHIQGKIVLTV